MLAMLSLSLRGSTNGGSRTVQAGVAQVGVAQVGAPQVRAAHDDDARQLFRAVTCDSLPLSFSPLRFRPRKERPPEISLYLPGGLS